MVCEQVLSFTSGRYDIFVSGDIDVVTSLVWSVCPTPARKLFSFRLLLPQSFLLGKLFLNLGLPWGWILVHGDFKVLILCVESFKFGASLNAYIAKRWMLVKSTFQELCMTNTSNQRECSHIPLECPTVIYCAQHMLSYLLERGTNLSGIAVSWFARVYTRSVFQCRYCVLVW